MVRFLLSWYQSHLRVSWNGVHSDTFPVSRGVRQGGVISPILFALYIDDLLYELEQSGVGCFWDDLFVGALTYANDLTLLAPSPAALRRLLYICEQFGATNMLRFNPDKTQCIKFSRTSCTDGSCTFLFCGKSIFFCQVCCAPRSYSYL